AAAGFRSRAHHGSERQLYRRAAATRRPGRSTVLRRARAQSATSTMGSQGVGVVESVGEGVTNVHVGDRVTCIGNTYAMYALSPAQALFPIVEGVSFEQAAAGQGQGWLAYAFTHHAYPVQAGDWCMVQAAAGGLGLL